MEFECTLPEELEKIAAEILQHHGNQIYILKGSMGAGKTTFVKAACKHLGCVEEASSPTFSLVNEYVDGQGNALYHFDMYRLEEEYEALDFGFEEYLSSGSICFIEWPEKVESLLPPDYVQVDIIEENDIRKIRTSHIADTDG